MADSIEERIAKLSDGERASLIRELAEKHPRIAKGLLDRVDLWRARDAARAAMPPHPFTEHELIEGMHFCYFRSEGATCLREANDPLHSS